MVALHTTCEAVASGMVKIMHIPSEYKLADVFTKPLANVVLDRLMLESSQVGWRTDLIMPACALC